MTILAVILLVGMLIFIGAAIFTIRNQYSHYKGDVELQVSYRRHMIALVVGFIGTLIWIAAATLILLPLA